MVEWSWCRVVDGEWSWCRMVSCQWSGMVSRGGGKVLDWVVNVDLIEVIG